MVNKVIEFKITGEHNQPHTIPLSELKEILENFEGLFLSIANKLYPEIKNKDFNLSLINISEGSTCYAFSSDYPEESKKIGSFAISAIRSKDLTVLPIKAARRVEYFKDLAKKKNCHLEIYSPISEAKLVAKIEPLDEYLTSRLTIKSETTLYGFVFRIGGRKPTAWISLDNGDSLYVRVDIPTARQLASFLYQRIGFTGIAEWDAEDYSIISFENFKLIDYHECPITEAFKSIAEISGDAWQDVDVISFISDLRDEEDLDDSLS